MAEEETFEHAFTSFEPSIERLPLADARQTAQKKEGDTSYRLLFLFCPGTLACPAPHV